MQSPDSFIELKELAKDYLQSSPKQWILFSEQLVKRVARYCALELESTYGQVDVAELKNLIAEALLPEILSPELATIVAKSKSAEDAGQEIVHAIAGVLRNLTIQRWESDDDADEIVDIASGGGVVRSWDGYGFIEGDHYSTFTPLKADTSEDSIYRILEILLRDETHQITNEQSQQSSISLDIIDLALYHALLQHPELLKTLNWRVFEKLLADILSTFGYEIELQRGTKDGGIDIFALGRNGPLGFHRYLLQAKRWSNSVGIEPVRELLFLHSHHRATKSCLATTATFTRGAWELAQQYQWQMSLRDYEGIHDWIRQALKIKKREG